MKWIALLRGVNVGGHRKLPMAELRDALEEIGYQEVKTLLASGNLVFEAKGKAASIEAKLEADLKKAFGLTTEVMVRDPKEWAAIIEANPFLKEAKKDPSHLVVVALKAKPPADAVKALASYEGPELVKVHQREAYVFYGDRMADSKLNLSKLGSGTARNWNTVLKLQAMVE